ncbi:hypothetical protein NJB14197_04970 [Mycobacterium montefiorense]|uniref:Uncharacterized protein n=1 Tax=Mycobacterium montefiorense TaxID=154654 RepID=A0AA37PRI2_9MYCO|nr:hypothetical protein MmonteBS_38000 [Mycobacterium montefiorense]GKU33195.1 hypothetical protein NJB14191_05420 [Mycobacterium montefiorense]GKU42230.1 hypothetical protein NJB14192_42130 [Mycobacterium montefiorense]GKU44162.1 hypothetical protein NJB14194_07910 [Mycobacterium montefiorense]GKU53155.1 hypothetical protein NJB14195_43960 [Mycobacterium montefiorense]
MQDRIQDDFVTIRKFVDAGGQPVVGAVMDKGFVAEFADGDSVREPCETVARPDNDDNLLFAEDADVGSGGRWRRPNRDVDDTRFQPLDHRISTRKLGQVKLYFGALRTPLA